MVIGAQFITISENGHKQGIMEKIFNYFCANAEQSSQIQIDSTYVKAHQYSAGAKKRGIGGGNRKIGGFTSKIHAATDENGKVIDIFITGGNIHDSI